MAKTGTKIVSNTGGPAAYAGYIQGIADTVDTDLYIGSALNYMHAELALAFNTAINLEARSDTQRYHHLYEQPDSFYGGSTVGRAGNELWTHVIAGRGRSKIATFQFLPSTKPVPVNPILTESPHRVKTGIHIFHWKAPVFEYGIEVNVEPQLSPLLVFVGAGDKVVFTPYGTSFVPGEQSGNEGMFTNFFLAWWTTAAGAAMEKSGLKKIMESDVASRTGINRATTRAANKAFALSVRSSDNEIARNEARTKAHQDMKRKSGRYIDAAAARRAILYGV